MPSIIFALDKMKVSEIIISNRTKSKAEDLSVKKLEPIIRPKAISTANMRDGF